MYSRDELFLRSLECYFGIYTKITLEWALKQFVTRVHTLFSILCMYLILLIGNLYGVSSHVAAYAHPCQFVSSCLWLNHVIAHHDVIKWKHFPRYWPFVWRIHRSPVNSPYKGQWPGFDVFFDLRLIKRLIKQSWGWWFETPSGPLWRHCKLQHSQAEVKEWYFVGEMEGDRVNVMIQYKLPSYQ